MNAIDWIVREARKREAVKNRVVELVTERGSMTRKALIRATGLSSASIDRYINAGVRAHVLRKVMAEEGLGKGRQVRVELA